MVHFIGDDAQILSDQTNSRQGLLDSRKQGHTWCQFPMAIDGRGRIYRDFPCRLQAPKMVYAHHIEQGILRCHARYPPSIVVTGHGLPIVMRVTPTLAGSRKIIRWHTGYHRHVFIGIQFKQMRFSPNVCAIKCHKNRDVTKQTHVF